MAIESDKVAGMRAGAGPVIGFVVLVAAMALIAYSALYACGISWFGGVVTNCPRIVAVAAPAQAPVASRNRALLEAEAESGRLRADLASMRTRLASLQACPQPPAAAPPAPPSTPPPQASVPDAAWDRQDVKQLSGCWSLSSDYKVQDIKTKEIQSVTSWTMCFDEQGNGSHEMRIGERNACNANVTASFKGTNRLEINEDKDIHCADGRIIFKRQIVCERTSSRVSCEILQPQTGSRANVGFVRK